MTELQERARGNETDYVLGTELGWGAFDVVQWRGVEAMDEPFCYEIVLAREVQRGPVDLDGLLDGGATFCIATEARWRRVHGVVTQAELLDQTRTQLLYKVELMPHLARAAYRRHCRTFTDRSLREIVAEVLAGDGAAGLVELAGLPAAAGDPDFSGTFAAPAGMFRWAVSDRERLERPRRFVVQYNETDLAFVSRLLEVDGIAYFFEHTADACVLTMSDRPGLAPLFERDAVHELLGAAVGGAARDQEVVRQFHPRRTVRPQRVRMRDYAWRRSLHRIEAVDGGGGGFEHYEFPAADEDVGAGAGKAPAQFQRERYDVERRLCRGLSTVRTHEPGYRFRLEDRSGVRGTEELLLVRAEMHAVQLLPESDVLRLEEVGLTPRDRGAFFECAFEAVPVEAPYRPARKTPKPVIAGVQTARVTAEEVSSEAPPELNSDEMGRVRVRFPWDQREPDGTASSKWIRVSQYWAGPSFGALYVPRVGHEVLVAFERGDPDRPIIVGRVYNAQNPPPYTERNTTISTIKSDSVGEDGSAADGFNELRFEDAAEKEQVFLHAQRNLDEVVRANHSTSVGGNQSNTVGGDQSNEVFGSRTHHVHGTELVQVDGARTTVFGDTESHSTTSHRVTGIGANDTLAVGADHSVNVSVHQRTNVGATRSVEVVGAQSIKVGSTEHYTVKASRSVSVGGEYGVTTVGGYANTAATHRFASGSAKFIEESQFEVKAGSAVLSMQSGKVVISDGCGAIVALVGGTIIGLSADVYSNSGQHTIMSAGTTNIRGATTNISASGNINATAGLIKLNG